MNNTICGRTNGFMDMPEAILRKIPAFMRFVFISAVIVFLLIHMYCLTNQLVNHDYQIFGDGIGGINNDGGGLSSGRFLLAAVNAISSRYTVPWFTGLLCALYFGLAMCLLTSLFEIRHKASAVLMSVVIASFPTATSTLAFMYTADAYFFSLLLACLAVFFTCRYRWGFVAGTIFIAADLAIYQAYFPFAAALMVLWLMLRFASAEYSVGKLISDCVRCFITLVMALAVYKLALDALLSLTGTELSSYLGLNSMWYISPWELGGRILTAFRYTLLYYKANPSYNAAVQPVYIVMLACLIFMLVFMLIKNRIYKKTLQLLTVIVLLVLFPLVCSLIWVMSGSVHTLMVYPVVLPVVAVVLLLDRVEFENPGHIFGKAVCLISLVSVLFIGVAGVVVANKAYIRMDTVFKNAYSFAIKLSTRIEMAEGYEQGMPVMFVGELDEYNRPIQSVEMHKDFSGFAGVDTEHGFLMSKILAPFCGIFLGEDMQAADKAQREAVMEAPEFAEMRKYPHADSVKVIEDVVVVRLGDQS